MIIDGKKTAADVRAELKMQTAAFEAQYGKKVVLGVTEEGTYLGGVKISETKIGDLGLTSGEQIRFRIAVPETAEHCGGVTVFGKGFGDYDEGIVCNFVCR